MGELNAEQIAQRAIDLDLLDDRQLQDVWGQFGRRNVPTDEFLQVLLRRELLTNYQVDRLLKGERTGFFHGDYKVLYLVATGTFARVYRAVQRKTGQVVALKVLRRRYSDNPEQTEQFCREGEMGRALRHPNIVPIYEVYSEGRVHFLVMEFVEGHNLRDFLKVRKQLDAAEATRLMIGILSGLNYAANRGVSHRDIKLTNILISSRGQPRLVDFGLAAADERISDDAVANHPNPRTIDYAGLERATGVRKDDGRSDIYFAGCIFYHMLVGQPALQETKDRIQRLSKTRYLDVNPIHQAVPSIPWAMATVVNKAMELDPERRYQTPGQMLLDLNLAAKRLSEGEASGEQAVDLSAVQPVAGDGTEAVGVAAAGSARLPVQNLRVLMFVESNPRMQDIFRDGLKKQGYRVLLTSDPDRALSRFAENAKTADCVIFSTGDIGKPALEAFNRFAEGETTRSLPAVLLLDKRHHRWKSEAKLDDHRIAVKMPIKLRELRSLLADLVPPESGEADEEA